ncbi:ECF RNA polymerase sigma factor SigW [Kordia antarctica]|uniref:ECF RNA polymerase sigma factor SigW n=1 Tax=Kordia antarctica TaxID=1218801 RepID=A0A7L4ZFQ8_9FLAO|nr:sigma-70 family RNA polymerase sigma factor [Kordia antarctica]QHI35271.1 ECF RNA polymerase sigma factor SigW [Kordia antarctica]
MFQTELIKKCKNNDRKAQLHLYRQYCEGMFIVANRFLKHTEDAEDAMQEAFINAFQKIDQFKAEVSFGAWLKKIVIHKSLDKLRAKQNYYLTIDEAHLEIVADEDSWETSDETTLEEVKNEIENLPEKYRIVVMLFLLEGYDHQEISEILNISTTASRTQLLRGKKKLQQALKKRNYGTGY